MAQSSPPRTAKALATCAGMAGSLPLLGERLLDEFEAALDWEAPREALEGVLTVGGVATREPGVGVAHGETLRLGIGGSKPVLELLRDGFLEASTSLRMLSCKANKSSGWVTIRSATSICFKAAALEPSFHIALATKNQPLAKSALS